MTGVQTCALPISPAASAGIKAKDEIIKIDDKSTEGMTVQQAAKLIRGKEGTHVVLTIKSGKKAPDAIDLKRAQIKVPKDRKSVV